MSPRDRDDENDALSHPDDTREIDDFGSPDDAIRGGRDRGRGPLESMFQEAVRRATAAGLSGFFFTEEAIRKAVSESVPPQWVSFLSQQSGEVREDVAKRIASEIGSWLQTLDVEQLMHAALDGHEFEVDVRIRAKPRKAPGSTTPGSTTGRGEGPSRK